eukprot:1300722-Pyramimonas_sp.AAC.1
MLGMNCPVCLRPIEADELVITYSCRHQLHAQCVAEALSLSSAPSCPLRRNAWSDAQQGQFEAVVHVLAPVEPPVPQ